MALDYDRATILVSLNVIVVTMLLIEGRKEGVCMGYKVINEA